MSTDYRFRNPVPFTKIKKLKLEGIKVVPAPDADPDEHVCLTDGVNYLHAYTGDGTDTGLTRYALNDPASRRWTGSLVKSYRSTTRSIGKRAKNVFMLVGKRSSLLIVREKNG